MKITIFLDPLPQSRVRFSGGRCYEERRLTNYKEMLKWCFASKMEGKPPTPAPVAVDIKFFRKYKASSRRFGDCDNLAKAVMDACNGIIWADDCQVTRLTAAKYTSQFPRLELEITPI